MRRVLLALVLLAAACGGTPDTEAADAIVSEARQLDLDGRHEDAVARFREALDRGRDSFDVHYGIGRALDLAGEYEDARRHFARAIELAPDALRQQALRMMGIAWTFAGDAGQAEPYFREVFDRRAAAGNFAGAAEVANELGRVHLELGVLDAAERWYRTGHATAAREPGRPASQVDLAALRLAHAEARIAARRGRPDEAQAQVAEVRRILDTGTNADQEVYYPHLVGYVAFHLGDAESAVSALEKADLEDPFVLALLAQAHEALGHQDQALDYYRRTLTSASHGVANAFVRPLARRKIDILTGGSAP